MSDGGVREAHSAAQMLLALMLPGGCEIKKWKATRTGTMTSLRKRLPWDGAISKRRRFRSYLRRRGDDAMGRDRGDDRLALDCGYSYSERLNGAGCAFRRLILCWHGWCYVLGMTFSRRKVRETAWLKTVQFLVLTEEYL